MIHGTRDLGQAGDRRVLARRRDALLRWGLVDVEEAHLLHGVEVIEVAPEFMKAVRGRQRIGVVAEVVLAELAGVVTEVAQEPCERRGAGLQVSRAARELRRDHAGAQRMHAGKEGISPGGAALLGIVVGEHRTLIADAVDVGRLANCKATMIDARLHNADVITHDEKDVGFLCGCADAGWVHLPSMNAANKLSQSVRRIFMAASSTCKAERQDTLSCEQVKQFT